MVTEYYNQLCAEWAFTPTQDVCTGYESVEKDLRRLTKQSWDQQNESGRQAIENAAFDIYRSVGILPIEYYTLEGFRHATRDLSRINKAVVDGKLGGGGPGQNLSRFWFPNMQDAAWNTNDTVSLKSRFWHDAKLRRAIKICYKFRDNGNKAVFPNYLRTALELVNGGTIQNFKVMNARAIWEHICPTLFGDLLDFSSGYGGRMMGAMTSRMQYNYTGIDPNTKTFAGLQALGELIAGEGISSGFTMHNTVSEEFDPDPGRYDAAFSSPPYFNLERYCDEPTQCMNRYKELDSWFEGYVTPTIRMLHRALSADGIYAVNIADYRHGKNSFAIVEPWIELSEKLGFRHVETVHMILPVRPGVGNNRLEKTHKAEGIYIFKK